MARNLSKAPTMYNPISNFGADRASGRKIGTQRKLTIKVLDDILRDWRAHGPDAIAACREQDPAAYLRVVVSLLPKIIDLNVEQTVHHAIQNPAEWIAATLVAGPDADPEAPLSH